MSTSVTIERTPALYLATEHDAVVSIDLLDWYPVRTVEMTVENRGAAVHLRRNQRLVWGERIWYGAWTSYVELRVWHDGSVTVEDEVDR